MTVITTALIPLLPDKAGVVLTVAIYDSGCLALSIRPVMNLRDCLSSFHNVSGGAGGKA